jgi:hypothetical protein
VRRLAVQPSNEVFVNAGRKYLMLPESTPTADPGVTLPTVI